jgi:CRISPR-associated protein Cas2
MGQPELQTLVVYDIVNDRIRYRVANACKDYGLERIQFSAFSGELTSNRRQELFLRLRRELGEHPGKILVVPICEKDLKARQEIVVRAEQTEGVATDASGAGDAGGSGGDGQAAR